MDIDVLFLCGGHGKAKALLLELDIPHSHQSYRTCSGFSFENEPNDKRKDIYLWFAGAKPGCYCECR